MLLKTTPGRLRLRPLLKMRLLFVVQFKRRDAGVSGSLAVGCRHPGETAIRTGLAKARVRAICGIMVV